MQKTGDPAEVRGEKKSPRMKRYPKMRILYQIRAVPLKKIHIKGCHPHSLSLFHFLIFTKLPVSVFPPPKHKGMRSRKQGIQIRRKPKGIPRMAVKGSPRIIVSEQDQKAIRAE